MRTAVEVEHIKDDAAERHEFKDAWEQERKERIEMQAHMQAKIDGLMETNQTLRVDLGIMTALHKKCACPSDKI